MLFVLKRIGFFIVDNWKLAAGVVGVVAVLILFGLVMSKCSPKPKIDMKAVNEINSANEVERKKVLEKTITENASVVKTVDERKTIAEVSEAEKQTQIYVKIQEVDAKIAAAKAQGRDVTGPELECLLMGCK